MPRGVYERGSGPSCINQELRQRSTDVVTGQSALGKLSRETPSSQVTLGCVKPTIKTKEDTAMGRSSK